MKTRLMMGAAALLLGWVALSPQTPPKLRQQAIVKDMANRGMKLRWQNDYVALVAKRLGISEQEALVRVLLAKDTLNRQP